MNLRNRSNQPEIIDTPEAMTPAEVEETLSTLRQVNRWLGGNQSVLAPARRRLSRLASGGNGTFRVLDVGCGDAEIPLRLVRWAARRGWRVSAIAFDFNFRACRSAARRCRESDRVGVIQADALQLPFAEGSFDLALCSTFLHHFDDSQAASIVGALRRVSREALIVNDLHRHRLAYYSIRILTALLWRSRPVRHDGPLSVLKGFRRPELIAILKRAGAGRYRLRWRWAFRWSLEIEA